MQLEDYFSFETVDTKFGPVDQIRIKGHRIGIEHVVDHFKEGLSAETIFRDVYPTLSLEKVYATILYYLANEDKVEEYIRHGAEIGDQYYQEYLQQPETEAMRRVKALKVARMQRGATPAVPATAPPTSQPVAP